MISEFASDPVSLINRYRKSNSLVAAIPSRNGGADGYHVPIKIDQGAAGITWIDRGVSLNHSATFDVLQSTVLCADNASAHRCFKPEWTANR